MYGDLIDDIRVIMTDYYAYYGNTLIPLKIGKKTAEHFFQVDLTSEVSFRGYIDMVCKSGNGMTWVTEHKTTSSSIPSDDFRWKNMQSLAYTRVLEEMGIPVDGCMWNYVRSKPPSKPLLLKSGKLSEKQCDTLPTRLNETLAEHGFKAEDYPKLVNMAESKLSTWFKRVPTPTNTTVLNNVWTEITNVATEMADLDGKMPQHRSITRACDWCDYNAICSVELMGGDSDFVKGREYCAKDETKKTKRRGKDDRKPADKSRDKRTKASKLRRIRKERNREDDVRQHVPKTGPLARRSRRRR